MKVLIVLALLVFMVGCEEIRTTNGNLFLIECYDGKDKVFTTFTNEIKIEGDYLRFRTMENSGQIDRLNYINFKCFAQELTPEQIEQMKKVAMEQAKKFEEQKKAYEAEAAKKVDTEKPKK